MPTDLSDLDLDEVSTVDFGANQYAKILLYKRGGAFKTEFGRQFPMGDYAYVPDPTKPSTWKLRLTADPGGGANIRIVGAAVAALGPTGFRGRKVQIPSSHLPKVKAKVLAAWKTLHPDAKELPASLTKKEVSDLEYISYLKFYLYGEQGGTVMDPKELEKRLGELEGSLSTLTKANEELTKRAEAAEAAVKKAAEDAEALKSKLEKGENPFAKPKEDEEDEEDMKKSMPDDVRKRFDDLEKRAKEGEETIAKLREEKEREIFVSKAASSYSKLPVSAEELGEALRGISKAAPGSLEVIEKALAAGDKALADAMVEKGSSSSGGAGDAYEDLQKIASDIVSRDGVTKEQAFVKAKNENPDLWKKHREEVRSH